VLENPILGRTAVIIAVSYGLLGGVVVLVIAALVWSSTTSRHRNIDLRKLAEREKTWFAIVVVFLVGLLFGTIFFTPYGRSATSGAQVVKVTGEQFAWVFPRTRIRAGREVEFELNSPDVNHDFAVFNPQHTFLFQTQVLPGKTSQYVYTFEKPGRYTVECWEYCGLGHDAMTTEFTVTP
jgi:heme/copper-type cytochrome/quinol oxidase subunit 2